MRNVQWLVTRCLLLWCICAVAVVTASDVVARLDGVTTVALDVDTDVSLLHQSHHDQDRKHPTNASLSDRTTKPHASQELLVIGVKTSVLHGYEARQAIRETWAHPSRTTPLGVRVLFLGCSPDLTILPEQERGFAQRAITLEKQTYNDLLTQELRCMDSFATLVDKTVEFLFHINSITHAPFVMIADDDVFVRLNRLAALLQSNTLPRERLYAGSEAHESHRKPSAVERDPQSRYFLPVELYPMSELPPFVAGAHYLITRDVVQFIALNRDDLRGLGALDDVTMALWMLALQIHPLFLNGFDVLRNAPCSRDFISYADLSPQAMRRIQLNIDRNSDNVCAGYSYESWSKHYKTITFPTDSPSDTNAVATDGDVTFDFDLQHDPASNSLHIQVGLTARGQRVALEYVPSAGSYDAVFCSRLLAIVRSKLNLSVGAALCAHHRDLLLAFVNKQYREMPSLVAKTTIVRHNLARAAADDDAAGSGRKSPVLVIAMSTGASYARVLLECLYSQMYPTHHIVALAESDLSPHEASPPDVFAFSILDDTDHSVPTGDSFVRRYVGSQLVMVSGEAFTIRALDPRVTLISTVSSPRHNKHLDLPLAASMFGEAVRNHPLQLLAPAAPLHKEEPQSERRFCAYLYHNCQRTTREYMYDLLNDVESVDALGKCQGTKRDPLPSRQTSRMSDFYIDEAVDMYRDYKFAITFENAVVPGYITEKIVTAFLAGAIPIYYGYSATATKLFNPRAFIDCGAFASLRACADHVLHVYNTPSLYAEMRSQAPITDMDVFLETFSWHPAVREMMEQANAARGEGGQAKQQYTPLSEQLRQILAME